MSNALSRKKISRDNSHGISYYLNNPNYLISVMSPFSSILRSPLLPQVPFM